MKIFNVRWKKAYLLQFLRGLMLLCNAKYKNYINIIHKDSQTFDSLSNK